MKSKYIMEKNKYKTENNIIVKNLKSKFDYIHSKNYINITYKSKQYQNNQNDLDKSENDGDIINLLTKGKENLEENKHNIKDLNIKTTNNNSPKIKENENIYNNLIKQKNIQIQIKKDKFNYSLNKVKTLEEKNDKLNKDKYFNKGDIKINKNRKLKKNFSNNIKNNKQTNNNINSNSSNTLNINKFHERIKSLEVNDIKTYAYIRKININQKCKKENSLKKIKSFLDIKKNLNKKIILNDDKNSKNDLHKKVKSLNKILETDFEKFNEIKKQFSLNKNNSPHDSLPKNKEVDNSLNLNDNIHTFYKSLDFFKRNNNEDFYNSKIMDKKFLSGIKSEERKNSLKNAISKYNRIKSFENYKSINLSTNSLKTKKNKELNTNNNNQQNINNDNNNININQKNNINSFKDKINNKEEKEKENESNIEEEDNNENEFSFNLQLKKNRENEDKNNIEDKFSDYNNDDINEPINIINQKIIDIKIYNDNKKENIIKEKEKEKEEYNKEFKIKKEIEDKKIDNNKKLNKSVNNIFKSKNRNVKNNINNLKKCYITNSNKNLINKTAYKIKSQNREKKIKNNLKNKKENLSKSKFFVRKILREEHYYIDENGNEKLLEVKQKFINNEYNRKKKNNDNNNNNNSNSNNNNNDNINNSNININNNNINININNNDNNNIYIKKDLHSNTNSKKFKKNENENNTISYCDKNSGIKQKKIILNRIKNSNKPKNKINLINFEKDNNNPDKLGKNIKNEIEIDYSNVKEKMDDSILSKSNEIFNEYDEYFLKKNCKSLINIKRNNQSHDNNKNIKNNFIESASKKDILYSKKNDDISFTKDILNIKNEKPLKINNNIYLDEISKIESPIPSLRGRKYFKYKLIGNHINKNDIFVNEKRKENNNEINITSPQKDYHFENESENENRNKNSQIESYIKVNRMGTSQKIRINKKLDLNQNRKFNRKNFYKNHTFREIKSIKSNNNIKNELTSNSQSHYFHKDNSIEKLNTSNLTNTYSVKTLKTEKDSDQRLIFNGKNSNINKVLELNSYIYKENNFSTKSNSESYFNINPKYLNKNSNNKEKKHHKYYESKSSKIKVKISDNGSENNSKTLDKHNIDSICKND